MPGIHLRLAALSRLHSECTCVVAGLRIGRVFAMEKHFFLYATPSFAGVRYFFRQNATILILLFFPFFPSFVLSTLRGPPSCGKAS